LEIYFKYVSQLFEFSSLIILLIFERVGILVFVFYVLLKKYKIKTARLREYKYHRKFKRFIADKNIIHKYKCIINNVAYLICYM